MTTFEREAALRDARHDHDLVGNPERADEFFALVDHLDSRGPRKRRFLALTPDAWDADAQTRSDAAELAESLVKDQEWVASVSPDMDAPYFETKAEVGVRERVHALYAARPSARR